MAGILTASPAGAATAIRSGLALARRHWPLVTLVWALFAIVALLAAWPVWSWLLKALAYSPEGDRLLSGINLALLKELGHYDRSPTAAVATSGLGIAALVALLLNPFVAGGLIDVMLREPAPQEGRIARFFERGARHYGPMLRVLVTAGIGMLLVASLTSATIGRLAELAGDRGASYAQLVLIAVRLACAVAIFAFGGFVIDLARGMLVRSGSRRAVPAVVAAAGLAFRRFLPVAAILIAFGALFVLLATVTLGLQAILPGTGWPTIATGVVLQQLFAIGRTWLRAGSLGAALTLLQVTPDLKTSNFSNVVAEAPVTST